MKQLFSKQLPKQPLLALLVFVTRLGALPANVSPLGSFGFFGPNILLYCAVIIGFDLLVGGLYQGMVWTYLGFAVYPVLGYLAKNRLRRQLLLLPLASFAFFLLSNFGVFLAWYEHSLQGFLACYALALPFYSRTLLGDLLFGYGFLSLRHYWPLLRGKLAFWAVLR